MRRNIWGSRPVKAFLLAIGICCLGIVGVGLKSHHAQAAAGINKQISFQGKVVAKSDGTNVTDGSYSFTFRIYTSSSADTGSPCASSCIWEETKTLTVTSGIFQTNLGDTTSLPGSVDFNSDTLYLGVKFNGDTEMSPRIRLTAVPYAFNADKLGGLSSSSFAQLSPGSQQTGSLNISGDMNIGSGSAFKINGTSVCSGTTCTAASGSSFYVQNGTGTQTANMNIQSASGGSIAALIQGAASQTVDIFEVKDSSNNVVARVDNTGNFTATNSVGVGTIASATTKLLVQSGLANIETINSSTASSKLLTLKGAASQTGDLIQNTDTNGAVLSGVNANGGIYTNGVSSSVGNLTVPTISSVVATGSGGSLVNTTTYWYAMTATNAAGETIGSTSTSFVATSTGKSLVTWSQINGATGYKLYRNTSNSFSSGSLLLTTIANGTTTTYTDTGSATTTGLPPTSVTGTGLTIQGWSGQTGSLLQVQNSSGTALLTADVANSQINTLGLNVGGTTSLNVSGNLLNDGFESNSFASWTAGTAGSPTISTAVVRSGRYAANFNGTANNKKGSITASSTVYAREYVYISSASTTASMLWLDPSVSGNAFEVYRSNASAQLCIDNYSSGSSVNVGCGGSFALNAWHEVEARVTTGNGTGVTQLWLDGSQLVNATSQSNSTNNIDQVWIGTGGGETANMYVDDVAVGTADPGATSDILHVTGASTLGGNVQVQNSSGTTLLTADTTNMRIDIKGSLSTAPLGSNLLTNGDFASGNCSSWNGTCPTGWTITGNAAVHTANPSNNFALTQTITVVANTTYQIDFTETGATAGSLNLSIGANADTVQYWDTNTHRTIVAPSGGSQVFSVTPTTDFNGTVDNFTIKAISGSALVNERQLNSDGTVAIEIRSGGSGLQNTYIGVNAGQYSTTANGNVALGSNAFQSNTTGGWNAALGQNSLFSNTTGSWNSAVGQESLYKNTVGTSNVAVGQDALYNNVNGNINTAIGADAGYNNVSGYGNVFIGATAGFNETGNNKLYIADSTTSTPLIGGDFSGAQSLTVNGNSIFKPTGGNDSANAFQIQDASGNSLLKADTFANIVYIGNSSDQFASTFLTDSFENNNLATNWTVTNTGTCTIGDVSSLSHAGSYSMQANFTSACKAYGTATVTTNDYMAMQGWVYLSSVSSTGLNVFEFKNTSGIGFTLNMNASGFICVYDGTTVNQHCSTTVTMPTNSWHFVKFVDVRNGSTGSLTAYLDGVNVSDASLSGVNTGAASLNTAEIGDDNNRTGGLINLDDVQVGVPGTPTSLTVTGSADLSGTVTANTIDAHTASSTLTIGGTNATSIALAAATTIKATSTTALQVQNASSTPFFTVNSSTNSIQIGNTSADGTAVLLQLDQYNGGVTDPTGVAGAMYYNTTLNKLRCYQGSIWTNCLGTPFFPDRHWGVFSATGAGVTSTSAAGTIDTGSALTGDTLATNDQAEDMYVKHTSATTSGSSQAGYISATGTEERWRPYLQTRIKLDSTITSERLYVGVSAATPGSIMSDSPTTVVWGGIRYSTSASDTTFKCGAGNATASAFTDTGVTVTASHYYTMIVDWTTSGQITCRISDNGGAYTSTTVTTDVVTSNSAVLLNHIELTTLTTAARILNVAYAYVERN